MRERTQENNPRRNGTIWQRLQIFSNGSSYEEEEHIHKPLDFLRMFISVE